MNQDCIHDALNFIDDSMIQSVDVLRNRPYRLQKTFLRVGSLVATLCVLLVGISLLNPNFEVTNDSASINYGSVDETGALYDKVITEQSAESTFAGNSIRVKILELTDNGFFAEVIANYEPLDGAVSSNLTVIFTNSITEKKISVLKVGDIVDVLYGRDPRTGAKIYAYSIQQSSDE